jgi:hypothetical protein
MRCDKMPRLSSNGKLNESYNEIKKVNRLSKDNLTITHRHTNSLHNLINIPNIIPANDLRCAIIFKAREENKDRDN